MKEKHLTRAQRDGMRLHAQQVLACLTSPEESRPNPLTLIYLLDDLEKAAASIANDYAANNERAFHQKEYDKWKKVEALCRQELEKIAEYRNEFGGLGHHGMGRGVATHLLSDMSNLSYVLAMNLAGILKNVSTLTTAFGSAATSISAAASSMNSAQPYVGIGISSALVVFDTVCIAKHKYEREVEGRKKKEQSYTKFLEHGRWMHWVNAAAWIAAGVLATMSFATPVIIISVMAAAILTTSVVRIAHQAVELKKLTDVKKSYVNQLKEGALTLEKKEALDLLIAKITNKIQIQRGKLIATSILSTATMAGIGLMIGAIAMGACMPLLIAGAALLFIAGLITIITNRHAIGMAFKTIFKQIGKKPAPPHEPRLERDNGCSDEDFVDILATPEPGMRYTDRVPEDTRTKRALSAMARTHRPPTGIAKDVIDAIDKHNAEKREEALAERKNNEREVV